MMSPKVLRKTTHMHFQQEHKKMHLDATPLERFIRVRIKLTEEANTEQLSVDTQRLPLIPLMQQRDQKTPAHVTSTRRLGSVMDTTPTFLESQEPPSGTITSLKKPTKSIRNCSNMGLTSPMSVTEFDQSTEERPAQKAWVNKRSTEFVMDPSWELKKWRDYLF